MLIEKILFQNLLIVIPITLHIQWRMQVLIAILMLTMDYLTQTARFIKMVIIIIFITNIIATIKIITLLVSIIIAGISYMDLAITIMDIMALTLTMVIPI